jgi:hypothetical protein
MTTIEPISSAPEGRFAAPSNLTAARFFLALLSLLAAGSLPGLYAAGSGSGHAVGSFSLRWAVLLGGCGLMFILQLAVLAGLWSTLGERLLRLRATFAALKQANLLLALLAWAAFIAMVLWRFQLQLGGYWPRLWLFWLTAALAGFFLCAAWRKLPLFWGVLASAAGLGALVRLLGFLPDISSTPFTLAWSEASRFYYASLPLARQVYGQAIPLSPWHPSRYLLLGLPFIAQNLPIWFMRFYQVALWAGLSLGTGLALMRRFRLGDWRVALLSAAWAAIFMLQGPVYYHLHICVIIVLLGFDARRLGKSLLIVALASAWAGISRVNWYPVPAMLAITLYLLESPVAGPRGWLRYLVPPALWGAAGLATAAAANEVYMRLSGQPDLSVFNSTFSSALLWYRLLPNPTSPMGVLPETLAVTLPLLILLLGTWLSARRAWHPLRLLGLAGILAVMFVGGLVVSTKIGGGSNIHNLDAFIVLVVVAGSAVWMGVYTPETREAPRPWRPWLLTFVLIALPLAWAINIGSPFTVRGSQNDSADLAALQGYLKSKAPQGEILFITQRQLFTFGLVKGIQMVPDYEVLTLSEMSLSRNLTYLNRFYHDLNSHRFAAIVVDPQREIYQNPASSGFAEENNAWVQYISVPLLKSYQTGLRIDRSDGQTIDVMIPRP